MSLIKSSEFGHLHNLLNVLDNVMNHFPTYNNYNHWFSGSECIVDTQSYTYHIPLPGFDKDNVSLKISHHNHLHYLLIDAKHTFNNDNNNTQHTNTKTFKERILLHEDSLLDSIKTTLKNGVLTIHVPRTQKNNKHEFTELHID